MKTLRIVGLVLSTMFMASCGVESPAPEPASSVDESAVTLPQCSAWQDHSCPAKGHIIQCDNGTPDPGFCICIQHGGGPFFYNCPE